MTDAPHLTAGVTSPRRRGAFWISGRVEEVGGHTMVAEAMFVDWEAPAAVSDLPPLIFVHGGGGQGTDWTMTPDGRPGWRDTFVDAGFPVYIVDRPVHGRAAGHPALATGGGSPPVEIVGMIFAPEGATGEQSQWPWDRTVRGDELIQLAAAQGPLPADAAIAQTRDAEFLSRLLDRIGPAVLVTHSAGAPSGWLAAQLRPELVRGIVAVEPMGPPFVDMPGFGSLTWGITSAALIAEPPVGDPGDMAADAGRILPGITGLPVLIVTGGASSAAPAGAAVADFLAGHGAVEQHIALEERGILGNGHGLMFEANCAETAVPVIGWLEARIEDA